MSITLRLAHLAVAGAFLAGIVLVVAVALAFSGGDSAPDAVVAPSATPRPSATAAASATPAPPAATQPPTPTDVPTAAPSPQAPAQPAQTAAAVRQPAQPGDGYTLIGAVWADESIPVPYCVNPANPPINSAGAPIMSDEAFAAAVRRAFQAWQDIPGSYIAFRYTGFCSNDPFDFRDQVNTIGWGWLFSSAIGATGPSATHGKYQRQSSAGQYYEADIIIDVRYAQSFDDEGEYVNRALPAVLLHEAGHFFGLDHSQDPCSIMQPVITEDPPALCAVDMNGARALYPQ